MEAQQCVELTGTNRPRAYPERLEEADQRKIEGNKVFGFEGTSFLSYHINGSFFYLQLNTVKYFIDKDE